MRFSASSPSTCRSSGHRGRVRHPGQTVAAFFRDLCCQSGSTGGPPANIGGISIIALVMSTATGFRSEAYARRPNRCASKGIDPPPQKGSSTGGAYSARKAFTDLWPGLHDQHFPRGDAFTRLRPLGMRLPFIVAEDDRVFRNSPSSIFRDATHRAISARAALITRGLFELSQWTSSR